MQSKELIWLNIYITRVMSKNPFEIKKTPRAIVSAQAIKLDDFVKKSDQASIPKCGTGK